MAFVVSKIDWQDIRRRAVYLVPAKPLEHPIIAHEGLIIKLTNLFTSNSIKLSHKVIVKL